MSLKTLMTTRNVGPADRLLRTLPAIAVALLWAFGLIGGAAAAVLAVLAGLLLLTALTGTCSLYVLFGWSTCPAPDANRD